MPALSREILDALRSAVPAGPFHPAGDKRWVSEPVAGIRRIIEFQALKGGVYSARWGFSVDFVPTLSGKKLSIKGSVAKAAFDLCIDPIDEEGKAPDWCAFRPGDKPTRIEAMARKVAAKASADFDRVSSLAELVKLFEQRSQMSFRRFSLDSYVQTDIAWGLALNAIGRQEAAAERLARFCDDFGIDPNSPILTKAKAEALKAVPGET